ncbi:putative ATP-dependent helicase [Vespula squamosa]|uniref:ATP-dependent helicase n=1 Tax=Vespula squamosa TaxID=30214 RepID=A0ABD2A631_VESSQ
MKNAYPVVTTASSSPVDPVDSSISRDDISKDEIDNQTSPIIRLKLDKPLHWYWELTTTADAVLPVIQLLDKDGRLLVETTGKTAQRARGSFREGLIDYEKFPLSSRISRSTSVNSKSETIQSGNRNIDGFSNKFGPSLELGYKPRKSRSDASIKVVLDKKMKNKENDKDVKDVKRYSTGDFLRRQILDDLRTKNMFGKSPDEIAKERCRKVKAYLKSQSEVHSSSDRSVNADRANESDEKDLRNPFYSVENDDNEKYVDSDELVKIRSFLRERLRERMESTKNEDNNLDSTIKKRHSERKNDEDSNDTKTCYRTRKVRSDTNVINSPGRKTRFEDIPDNDRRCFRSNDINDTKNVLSNLPSVSSNSKKNDYRRSKSDALLVRKSNEFVERQRKYRSAKRESTDRRRTYRKTKSDLHFDDPNTEKELDGIERSWRDYKERKKLEKLQREKTGLMEEEEEEEKEDTEEKEDNFRRNQTNDFKRELCVKRNCKVCQNLRNSLGSPMNENIVCPFETNDPTIESERSIDPNSQSPSVIVSPDFGYNSIHKSAFKDYRELYARSNVKKSDTFKIIDGSEEQEDSYKDDDSNLIDDNRFRDNKSEMVSLINKSNEDIARDYFKRVYELLKKRQEEARKLQAEKRDVIGYDDSSSSNYVEEVRRRKHRRKKRDPAQARWRTSKKCQMRPVCSNRLIAIVPSSPLVDSTNPYQLYLPL